MSFRRSPFVLALAPLLLAAGSAHAVEADAITDVSGVVVTAASDDGYKVNRTATATKTDTPLRDVPQSVSVISADLIRDQSMQGMADVVRYVPGVGMGQGEGHRDAPTLRGNASTADFFVDGVRDDVQYYRDLYNVQRVEVLKGPNAMIFGRGGGGGVINRVTKTADWTSRSSVSAELGSFDHRRFTTDLNRALSDSVAVRVNGLYENSGSYRDFADLERWGIAPTLTWRASDALTVLLSYEHFQDTRTIDRGVPSFAGRPLATDRGAFFGDPDFNHATTRVDVASALIEYAPSERFTVRNRTVVGAYDKYYQNSYASGAARAVAGLPATAPLGAYATDNDRVNVFNQTDLVWKLNTGAVEHVILAGAELGRQESDNRRRTGYFGGVATELVTPLSASTVRNTNLSLRAAPSDANNRVKARLAAVYLQDQVELAPWLQVVAGLRFDSVDIDFHDNRPGVAQADFSRTDELWSPRAGVILKPMESVSIYGSYSVSYLPSSGDQFGSLTASTQALKPEKFENLELGVKWDLSSKVFVTAAAYRLDRDNTTAPDPVVPGRVVLTGAQRSKGFEAGVTGQVTDKWQVIGGFASQEAVIRRATAACTRGGCDVPLVPKTTVSLWNRYDVSDRLGVGVGVVRQSKVFAAIDNTVTLPGFTRVDAAVFLKVTDTLRAQVNVENLFDKGYFPTSHGNNNIMPGAPRSVRVGLTADF